MRFFSSTRLTHSHQALMRAVKRGTSLLARRTAVSGGVGPPANQRRVEVTDVAAPSDGPRQRPDTTPPTVAASARGAAATPESQRKRAAAGQDAASARVTSAMVRSWAHERGIQISDRGRIPQSLMEQYLSEAVQTAGISRLDSEASSNTRPRASRSRSSVA